MISQISWGGKWNDHYTGKDVTVLFLSSVEICSLCLFYCLNCLIAVFYKGIILLNLLFFNLQGKL